MAEYIKVLLFTTAVAFLLTPVAKWLAIRIGAVDIPKDNRRMHKKPIPTIGGIAIFAAILISVGFFIGFKEREVQAIMLGSLVIVISGIYDDTKGLSPGMKIVFQLIAAIIAIFGDINVAEISNFIGEKGSTLELGFLSYPITIIWIIGITNAINLIDGLDGLAAGVSAIAALSLAVTSFLFGNIVIGIVCLIISGACLGFLPYNFNPASIFMGDTGALLLGYLFSVVTIEGVMKTTAAVAVLVPVIVLALPISDTLFAIVRRKLSGKSFAEADKGHFHHRIIDRGYTVRETVMLLYALTLLTGVLAVIISLIGGTYGTILAIATIILIVVGARKFGMFKS